MSDKDRLKLDDLEFSVRAQNAFKKLGVTTVGELSQIHVTDIIKVKGIGHRTLNDIQESLSGLGVTLKGQRSESPPKGNFEIELSRFRNWVMRANETLNECTQVFDALKSDLGEDLAIFVIDTLYYVAHKDEKKI